MRKSVVDSPWFWVALAAGAYVVYRSTRRRLRTPLTAPHAVMVPDVAAPADVVAAPRYSVPSYDAAYASTESRLSDGRV